MIKPASFKLNEQTIVDNFFQQNSAEWAKTKAEVAAKNEFDALVLVLRNEGVEILEILDTPEPEKPDSLFPNNWISTHENGRVCLYPMHAQNRRLERRADVLDQMVATGFCVNDIYDLSAFENDGQFLEGTGSMVLDRVHRLVYASISHRTHAPLVEKWCAQMSYKPVLFESFQTVGQQRLPVYHTNVVLSIGSDFALLCSSSIDNSTQRAQVIDTLLAGGRELIEISENAMEQFGANILEVQNSSGEKIIVMSDCAFQGLGAEVIARLSKYGKVIHAPIPTIERLGGGSVRCMLAEIFLPRL